MGKKMDIAVIGLGKFGMQVGSTLTELGHLVAGIDQNEHKVRQASEFFDQTFIIDAADKTALEQIRIQDFGMVVISVGESMETAILTALNLQELGVRNITVKASSPELRKVLIRLGVTNVVQPELDVAVLTAQRISNPGMLDLLPVGGGVLVQEVTVNKWEGKTLMDLDLMNKHGVLVMAVKKAAEPEYRFVPDPHAAFAWGDRLILLGKPEAVLALEA